MRKKKMDANDKVAGAVGIVMLTIIMLAMTSVVVDQVEGVLVDSDTWNFTGATGSQSILGLVPFVWIASVLVMAAVGMFALSKG